MSSDIDILKRKSYNKYIADLWKGMRILSVRNSAKAIVLHEGKILVNRCVSRFGEYYALPGGGQIPVKCLQKP